MGSIPIMGSIATRWKALSGEDEWEGLLDPLDIDLRRYIIHYGERAGAIAVVREPKSKNYRLARYAKVNMFSRMGLESGNPYKYVVKKYLYAAHLLFSSGKSSFLGYVAVTTDEGAKVLGRRDVLICWRGTQLVHEWDVDSQTELVSASQILQGEENDPSVHQGWLSYYTDIDPLSSHNQLFSCRDQAIGAVEELLDEYKGEEISITITGHSMGAAMATLNATDIVRNGYNKLTCQPNKAIPVTAIVFASPRLGNKAFGNVVSSLENLHVLRITNDQDKVPNLPDLEGYVHVGKELRIDTLKSPFLKVTPDVETGKFGNLHNLEIYLHGVAGTQGIGSSEFKLEVDRDLALVNKHIDGLKDEHNVVIQWWTEKNNSMIQMDDGSWVLDDLEYFDEA